MRRLGALFLALAITAGYLLPGGGQAALGYAEEYKGYQKETTQQYSDVSVKHWAFESIGTCSQRDWFNGYPDGTFKPSNSIRRDEAAKVFAVALGLPVEKRATVTYNDTGSNWAKNFIEATKGLFPNTTTLTGTAAFRPEQTITREETIYALVVAWCYQSKTENADISVLNMFSDKNSISETVKPYVAVAISEGLVSGIPDGKGGSVIRGQDGLSRAEFATLLARALSHGYGADEPYQIEENAPENPPQQLPTETPEATPQPSPETSVPPTEPPPAVPETSPQPTEQPEPDCPTGGDFGPEYLDAQLAAQQVLALVNQCRVEAGVEPLVLGDKLCRAANIRAKELEQLFSHDRPDGRGCFSVFAEVELNFWGSMGENIAMGYRSSESVMDGWINSAGHRANILSANYTALGVGFYQDDNGVRHWVQMFAGN